MTFAKNMRREKTLPRAKGMTTFNASGVYTPIYGKTRHLISGRGSPGNPTTGGNPNGTNPSNPANPPSSYWSVFYETYSTSEPGGSFYSSSGPNYGTSEGSTPASYAYGSYNPSTGYYTVVYTTYSAISFTPGSPGSSGNPKYNPLVPGNAGSPTTVFGVPFPGGAAGALAPSVAPTFVPISYTSSGTPVSVPPGGFVNITNQ